MTIPLEGTFDYVATVEDEALGTKEPRFPGKDKRGANEGSLLGPKPLIVVGPDRIAVVAHERRNAMSWKLSFSAGDAVLGCVQPGDTMHLSRSSCGGVGITVIRHDTLVLALGAMARLPLGGFRIDRGFEGELEVMGRAPANTWLDCRMGDESRNLRARESGRVGPYDVYVERSWAPGIPGSDECIAISRAAIHGFRDVAMRSAILLGNSRMKITGWDSFTDYDPGDRT